MIAEHNAGSATVEQLFQQLVEFIRSMSDKEKRAAREGLNEEELAIFDLLTKPEPKLTKAQEIEVKGIARNLLADLKREKLILDWRLKENANADVRQTIRDYDGLPEVYERHLPVRVRTIPWTPSRSGLITRTPTAKESSLPSEARPLTYAPVEFG